MGKSKKKKKEGNNAKYSDKVSIPLRKKKTKILKILHQGPLKNVKISKFCNFENHVFLDQI